jgi:hypothetical protein
MKNVIIKFSVLIVILSLLITCSKEIEPEIRYDLKVLATPTEGRTVTLNQLVKERRLFQKCRFFSSII